MRNQASPRAALVCGVVLAALRALPACGGTTVGSEGRPAPDPESPTATPAAVFTRDEVDAALSECEAPHGPVETYATVDELVALLSGRWIFCPTSGPSLSRASDVVTPVGIELTSDGHFFWLEDRQDQGVVRATGIAGAASYAIEPPTNAKYNDVSFQITVWYADRSQMGTYATFEAGPRRLAFMHIDGYFMPLKKRLG